MCGLHVCDSVCQIKALIPPVYDLYSTYSTVLIYIDTLHDCSVDFSHFIHDIELLPLLYAKFQTNHEQENLLTSLYHAKDYALYHKVRGLTVKLSVAVLHIVFPVSVFAQEGHVGYRNIQVSLGLV